jgi:hypothetical protein
MARPPSRSSLYMAALGRGVSKGSWGSNSSTSRKKRSWEPAEIGSGVVRHGRSRAPTRMSSRAGMHGGEPTWCPVKRRAVAENPVMQGVANSSLRYASSRCGSGCRGGRRSGSLGSPGHGASFDVAGRWRRGATPSIPPSIATGGDGIVDRSARPRDGDGPHPGVRRAGGQQAPSRSCPGPAGGPTPPPAWRRADCGATPRYSCPRASRTRPAHRNGCGRPRCRPTCREPGARVGGGGS